MKEESFVLDQGVVDQLKGGLPQSWHSLYEGMKRLAKDEFLDRMRKHRTRNGIGNGS